MEHHGAEIMDHATIARQRHSATVSAGVGDDVDTLLAAVEASMTSPEEPSASGSRRAKAIKNNSPTEGLDIQMMDPMRSPPATITSEARPRSKEPAGPVKVEHRRSSQSYLEEHYKQKDGETDQEYARRQRINQNQRKRRAGGALQREVGPEYTQEERHWIVKTHKNWAKANGGKDIPYKRLLALYRAQFPGLRRSVHSLRCQIQDKLPGLRRQK